MPNSTGAEREALAVMEAGGDLYLHFGSLMYGRTLTKADKLERQIAKSAVLGLGFGMGAARFLDYCRSMGIKITATEAESAVALYRNTYKGVKQLWSRVDKLMKLAVYEGIEAAQAAWNIPNTRICRDPLTGHVAIETGNGLMLKYPDLNWDADGQGSYRDGNRSAYIFGAKYVENIVQNLARNIMMDAMMDIDDHIPVVMSTYDEGVVMCSEEPDVVKQIVDLVGERLTRPHPLYPGLPIGAEVGYNQRYGDINKKVWSRAA
jgi:DNA polymerase